jgi:choline transport protein
MEKIVEQETKGDSAEAPKTPEFINASGHRQELDRNFSLINIVGLGLTTGNTWIAIGGSIVSFLHLLNVPKTWEDTGLMRLQVVAIYNGGPPGAIYEL